MGRNYRIPVVAAVISQSNRILVCQRKAGSRHGLKWEFPGGKIEKGESPRRALARELKEELGIDATVGCELMRYEFTYPKGATLLLIFHEVREFEGEIENAVFERIEWAERRALLKYDFLEGDMDFVKRLANGEW